MRRFLLTNTDGYAIKWPFLYCSKSPKTIHWVNDSRSNREKEKNFKNKTHTRIAE